MNTEEPLQVSDYLRVVPRPDGFALYHSLYGGLCIADNNILKVLDVLRVPRTAGEVLCEAGPYEEQQIRSLMRIFKARGFLVATGTDERAALRSRICRIEKQLHTGCQVGVVQLILTNRCNFRCEYCFINDIYSSQERFRSQVSRNNKTMSIENARMYLETIIRLVKNNDRKSLSVQFFGGEPLLNWKAMKFVLEHFGRGEKYGIEIQYSVVTNGSLVTDEIAEYCRDFSIPVIVSFDSPRGRHRTLANGKASTEKTERGLSILNNHGNRLVFNSVLSDQTFEYFDTDLVDFALRYYVFEIGVLLDLDLAFYRNRGAHDIVDRLWRVYKYGKQRGVLRTGYWRMIFEQLSRHNLFKFRSYKTCSGTGCQLSVEPSGEVFACKASSGYFGNIRDPEGLLSSKNYGKYAMRAFRNPRECFGCEIENFCAGFCLGPLEKEYGDINAVEANTCDVYRELTKRLIWDAEPDRLVTYKMPMATR